VHSYSNSSFNYNEKTQLALLLKVSQKLGCSLSLIKSFLNAGPMNAQDSCTIKRGKHGKINKQYREAYLARDSLKTKGESCSSSFFYSFIYTQGEK